MLRGLMRIGLLVLCAAAALGCGGDSGEQTDGPTEEEPRIRAYLGEIPRENLPPISIILRLNRSGDARINYQVGSSRPYRDERGTWREEGESIVLEFQPSEHKEGPLPSPIPMRVEEDGLVALAGSLWDEELHFVPYRKGP